MKTPHLSVHEQSYHMELEHRHARELKPGTRKHSRQIIHRKSRRRDRARLMAELEELEQAQVVSPTHCDGLMTHDVMGYLDPIDEYPEDLIYDSWAWEYDNWEDDDYYVDYCPGCGSPYCHGGGCVAEPDHEIRCLYCNDPDCDGHCPFSYDMDDRYLEG